MVDIEGSPLLAIKRFTRGDLPSAMSLAERVPGVQRSMLVEILEHDCDDLHGLLVGHDIDVDAFVRRTRLPAAPGRLLKDLNTLAKVVTGRLAPDVARSSLGLLPPSLLDGGLGLPFADGSVDAVAMSFVLSYLTHPDDTLAEAWRVLRPGGVLVVSSVVQDSDSSRMYLDLVNRLEQLPEAELPAGADPSKTRTLLANAARRFLDHAAELYRLEEEGQFRFYSLEALSAAVARRGFVNTSVDWAFGTPHRQSWSRVRNPSPDRAFGVRPRAPQWLARHAEARPPEPRHDRVRRSWHSWTAGSQCPGPNAAFHALPPARVDPDLHARLRRRRSSATGPSAWHGLRRWWPASSSRWRSSS